MKFATADVGVCYAALVSGVVSFVSARLEDLSARFLRASSLLLSFWQPATDYRQCTCRFFTG
jgi:hypothetical protein